MHNLHQLEQNICNIKSEIDFNRTAIDVFYFQYNNNNIYRQWVDNIGVNIRDIKNINQIPFLPITLFKTQKVKSFRGEAEIIFTSSGTTGTNTSKHYIKTLELYKKSYTRTFNYFYGNINEYIILALLPSYLERKGSSLILMAKDLINKTNNRNSGFYLYNYNDLYNLLKKLKKQSKKVILLGVSFALLEFAEKYSINFPELIVMETGGMKGKRKEILRPELHSILKNSFGIEKVHSEYGMTELMSQSYSKGDGLFSSPPWMKILIRDTNDPLSLIKEGKSGGINVIDLYNLYSCSFISTQDLGLKKNDNFEILGRFDYSDVRGCNLLIS